MEYKTFVLYWPMVIKGKFTELFKLEFMTFLITGGGGWGGGGESGTPSQTWQGCPRNEELIVISGQGLREKKGLEYKVVYLVLGYLRKKITPRLQAVLLSPFGVKENLSHSCSYCMGVTPEVLIDHQSVNKISHFVLFWKLSDQCPVD